MKITFETPPLSGFDCMFVAISAVVFIALCAVFWPLVVDDAYIVGR